MASTLLFDDDKPLALIRGLEPEVYVKCGVDGPASLEESRLLEQWGGRTRWSSGCLPRRSTRSDDAAGTTLINRLRSGVSL